MDQEEINYKVLREIQQKEKNSPLLTDIDKDFYKKFLEYVKNLELNVDRNYHTMRKSQRSPHPINLLT